jgi:hypothetical protein
MKDDKALGSDERFCLIAHFNVLESSNFPLGYSLGVAE